MKFEIKNRYTGAVQFTAEIEASENDSYGIKLGLAVKFAIKSKADLSWADLSEADLSKADLSWADLSKAGLSKANLSKADLSWADLSWADLSGADLSKANLSKADLSWADLSKADLSKAKKTVRAPIVKKLNTKIKAAITAGGKLKMDNWHTCETTHCRAGWAVQLAGESGLVLESVLGTNAAAALIYADSNSGKVPDFFASDEDAMKDIEACAAKEAKAD